MSKTPGETSAPTATRQNESKSKPSTMVLGGGCTPGEEVKEAGELSHTGRSVDTSSNPSSATGLSLNSAVAMKKVLRGPKAFQGGPILEGRRKRSATRFLDIKGCGSLNVVKDSSGARLVSKRKEWVLKQSYTDRPALGLDKVLRKNPQPPKEPVSSYQVSKLQPKPLGQTSFEIKVESENLPPYMGETPPYDEPEEDSDSSPIEFSTPATRRLRRKGAVKPPSPSSLGCSCVIVVF